MQPCAADCAYCLLETVEYVHGLDFVSTKLRILHDYPILPRACVPQLAAVLASAQRKAVAAALRSGAAFGLDAPEASVTDLFVPARGSVHGHIEYYQSVNRNEYLYRCGSEQMAEETWVITATRDLDAWSRCEGRVWLDLDSARARTDATDRSAEAGGMFFDLSVGQCDAELAAVENGSVDPTSSPDVADPSEQGRSQLVAFSEDASAVHVACSLLRRFGAFSTVRVDGSSSIVLLPSGMKMVQLLGHIVVHAGERLRIEARAGSPTSLAMGRWQIQVHAGAKLELFGIGIVDAVGASAMAIFGEVVATNCTFSRCVAGPNVVLYAVESTVPEGSNEYPPVRGVFLGSAGGAASLWFSAAKLTASNCTFSENAARGARLVSIGGALASFGGHAVMTAGTVMRSNVAELGGFYTAGGAINGINTRLEVSDAVFVGNLVNGNARHTNAIVGIDSSPGGNNRTGRCYGGAISLLDSGSTIASSVFKENKARTP